MKTDFDKTQEAYEFSIVTGNDKFVDEVSNRVYGLLLDTIKAECVRLSEQTGKPTDALVNRVKETIKGMLD